MPFTHSLVAALLWSAIAAVAYHLWQGRTSGNRGVILVGAAVLSHWFLDFLVHRPDLPLWANQFKVGLGLWNHPGVAFGLEAALLFGGLWLYLRATRPTKRGGTAWFIAFSVFLLAVQGMTFFGAPPQSPSGAALTALVAYAVIAAAAGFLELRRTAGGPVVA